MWLFGGFASSSTVSSTTLAAQPVPIRTIMDVLSSNPEFSELVNLLQIHDLVPFVNHIWNSTLSAPVNSAFIGLDKSTITQDQLLYHFINATVYADDITGSTLIYDTYLDGGKAPISLNREHGVNNKIEFDEMDFLASPQRGVVHASSQLVDIPDSLAKQSYLHNSLSLFSSFIDNDALLEYSMVLAPSETALQREIVDRVGINASEPILRYLRSSYGEADRAKLVNRHVWKEIPSLTHLPVSFEVLDGTSMTLNPNFTITLESGYEIRSSSTVHIARNGVYIELDGLLSEPDTQLFDTTAEKIIIGMGGQTMVKELTLYGHRDLINETHPSEEPESIIVPIGQKANQAVSHTNVNERMLPPEMSVAADPSSLISYQFLDSALPKNKNSKLVDSKMLLRSGKYPQRVHYEKSRTGTRSLNWEILGENAYQWNNTTFYSSSELLTAPPSLLMALGPLLMSSFSISFLEKLDRLQSPIQKSWTVFVPTRDAWEQNLLLKDYLETNDAASSKVFDNLILQAPIYSDTGEFETEQYSDIPTLVEWDPEFKEFSIRNKNLHSTMATEVTDALFDNGVAHIVNDVPSPFDLEISVEDLITAGGRSVFLDLLRKADMEYVLEPASNYTFLVPPPKELKKHNYTTETDIKKLQNMLKSHLIPDRASNKSFDGITVTTLAGEDSEIHSFGPSERFFGLTPVSATNGQQVLIFEYGFTNGVVSGGSGVLFINRHIAPEWIIPIKFGLRKGTYAVVGAILGSLGASSSIVGLFVFVSRPREDAGLFADEQHYHDDEEGSEDSDQDEPSSQPIETPALANSRAYGRHLNLPN